MKLAIGLNSINQPTSEGVSRWRKHAYTMILTWSLQVMAIKQALYSNRSLSELDLSETGSGSEGELLHWATLAIHEKTYNVLAAVALAECLPENRTLRRLDLSRNVGIDLAGLMALLASIRLNHTLAFLDLTVPVSLKGISRMTKILNSWNSLMTEKWSGFKVIS